MKVANIQMAYKTRCIIEKLNERGKYIKKKKAKEIKKVEEEL